MTELTPRQKSFCTNSGFVGMLIAISCFLQHFFIWETSVLTLSLQIPAILGIIAYLFLMLNKKDTGTLLILTCVLSFIRFGVIIWMMLYYHDFIVFNLIQNIYLLYTLVITVLFFATGYGSIFKKIAEEKFHEDTFWNNKL